MAVLSDNDRFAAWSELMRQDFGTYAITKADLRAALNAADAWADANAAAFNAALPQPARANLTARQKAAVLMYVISKRFQVT